MGAGRLTFGILNIERGGMEIGQAIHPREMVAVSRRRWLRTIAEVDRDGPSPGYAFWLFVAITLVGASLRIFHLGSESIYFDEAASWRFAHVPYKELWGSGLRYEVEPPLYYSLQRMWLVFGESEAALRSISALFGTLTIPIVYLIGRLVSGRSVGLIAAALTATSGIHLWYSQEARVYALLIAFALVAAWGVLLFLKSWSDSGAWRNPAPPRKGARASSDQQGRWLGLGAYAVGTTIALYGHNSAFLLPAAANLAALYWWVTCTGRARRFAIEWGAANLIPFVLWLWWLPLIVAQALEGGAGDFTLSWLTQPSVGQAVRWFAFIYKQNYITLYEPWSKLAPIPIFGVIGCFVLWRESKHLALVMLTFAIGVPIFAYVIGFVVRPIWHYRIVLWPQIGIGFVLIAIGLAAIRHARFRYIVLTIVFVVQGMNIWGYYTTKEKPPWRLVAEDLAGSLRPGDAVVLIPLNEAHWPFAYYAEKTNLEPIQYTLHPNSSDDHFFSRPGVDPDIGFPAVDQVDGGVTRLTIDTLPALAEIHKRIWVLVLDRDRVGADVVAKVEKLGNVENKRLYEGGMGDLEMMLIVPSWRGKTSK